MPDNRIDVQIVAANEEADVLDFKDVQYLSFVNGGTYGPPALIAESDQPTDKPYTVLYVNTENVVTVRAVRKA